MIHHKLFVFCLVCMLLSSCQQEAPTPSRDTRWVREAHYYEIPLAHLSEPNPLRYLSQNLLPHVSSMGANAIVLPPLMNSLLPEKDTNGYYVYPLCDLQAIQPRYGTLDSLRHFIESAHGNKLKVLMEFPMGYLGDCEGARNSPRRSEHTLPINWSQQEVVDAVQNALHFWADRVNPDGFVLQEWHNVPLAIRQSIYSALHRKGIAFIEDALGEDNSPSLPTDGYLNYKLYHLLSQIARGKGRASALEPFITDTATYPISIGFTSTLDLNRKEGTYTKRFRHAAQTLTQFALHTQHSSWLLAGQELPTSSAYLPGSTTTLRNANWYRGVFQEPYRSIWEAPRTNPALALHPNTATRVVDAGNNHIIAFEKKWKGYRWVGLFNMSDSAQIMVPRENIMNVNAYPTETSIAIHKLDSFRIVPWQTLLLTKH